MAAPTRTPSGGPSTRYLSTDTSVPAWSVFNRSVFTQAIRDRWRAPAIGAFSMALMLLFGMAAYREIDLSVYNELPDAFRSLIGLPPDADAAALAYGAIYTSYGALALAGIAIAIGAAAIAGEERRGTIGLLLANPVSRIRVLVSKAANLVLLMASGSVLLWLGGLVVPVMLDVTVAGMHVAALSLHMFVISVFFGFFALAIGAWTGRPGRAGGVASGVLVVSFFADGLLPLISGFEDGVYAFPWHYYAGNDPVFNGVDWGNLGILTIGILIFGVVSQIGVSRRDLRSHDGGVTLLDRLRTNRYTAQIVDRLAGRTRVSGIWVKTVTDHQAVLVVTSLVMFAMMGVMIGLMYPLMDDALASFSESAPEALIAMVGGGDMATPEGFFQAETFSLMAPIAVMIVTIVIGAKAMAGEEADGTMGLLLANPVSRSEVVLQKVAAMVVHAIVVGVATFAGVAAGSVMGDLGMSVANIAATTALVVLLGLVFGGVALLLGAVTGRSRIATFGAVGLGLITYLFNAFLPLFEGGGDLARWTPFYYYLTSDPLGTGMHWGHAAVLTATTVVLVSLAIVAFNRRDLRQNG